MNPRITRVADVPPVPWKNGGGMTRELLAWPDATDWIVRISVADIEASGPFSVYEGVDRWFAVLAGGDVRLAATGSAPRTLGSSQEELHTFAGEAATDCTALGAATRDFNIMLRRARGRLRAQSLLRGQALDTDCELTALFSAEPVLVQADGGAGCVLPGMALACWLNPRRAPLRLRAQAPARGWWIAADRSA